MRFALCVLSCCGLKIFVFGLLPLALSRLATLDFLYRFDQLLLEPLNPGPLESIYLLYAPCPMLHAF